jgi:hypothetical protein
MHEEQNQISVVRQPVQPSTSSRVRPLSPAAESLARKIVAWAVASVFVGRSSERRELVKLGFSQEPDPEMGELVRLALSQPALWTRETVTSTGDSGPLARIQETRVTA